MLVNGGAAAGSDYEVRGRELVFRRALRREGRLGSLRWLSDLPRCGRDLPEERYADVVFDAGGRRTVVSSLDRPARGSAVGAQVSQSSTPRNFATTR